MDFHEGFFKLRYSIGVVGRHVYSVNIAVLHTLFISRCSILLMHLVFIVAYANCFALFNFH